MSSNSPLRVYDQVCTFVQENEDAVERVKMKETHSRRYNNGANEMEVNVYGNKSFAKERKWKRSKK